MQAISENVIEHTYEQKVPMWDEAEAKQTAQVYSHKFVTQSDVPRLGVMLVGLGGNNGTTFTAGILANKKG